MPQQMNRHSETPGEAIRRQREGLGLSRMELAGRAEIHLSTIERIENGKVAPRRSTIKLLSDALGAEEAVAA